MLGEIYKSNMFMWIMFVIFIFMLVVAFKEQVVPLWKSRKKESEAKLRHEEFEDILDEKFAF